MLIDELQHIISEKLNVPLYSDYAPNGLQVAGCQHVKQIVTGVTACQALLDRAVALGADTIIVHHGYFWKNEPMTLTGIKQKRIKTLLMHDINLLAYHLPLDGHPELGNNAQIAKRLAIQTAPRSDWRDLLFHGELVEPMTGLAFQQKLAHLFRRPVLHCGEQASPLIKNIAWCSGGAQDYIEQAAERGYDAFLTGEVSERTIHIAREYGIHFYAAGHHATERYGIEALGHWLANTFGLRVDFVDIDNPA